MFEKILIANRGEIALRVIRACREMGIRSVAVYSEADETSLHVGYADEHICIGPGPSARSYLNIPAIISAAEISDAEAVHPGYGFLAENAHFAEICESCQIKFIGPPPEAIRAMGDKAAARELMRSRGVPVVEGSDGVVRTKEEALEIAHRIGYPVIVKAAAGGGGKGMKVAHNDVRLVNAFMTAQAEAEAAFGSAEVYIEKYIESPRHVEFQILADSRGNVIHLGERDCTIQRRHQKLIEESPAPRLDPAVRERMGEAAVEAAKAVGYVGAGTVEFLVDRQGGFYFIEMNTRLQVEHPVTEAVTGIDIVKEQIRVAAGQPLSVRQEEVRREGWAIECRINAEDPERDFIPCPGKITFWHPPGGPGVRVDSHVYTEYVIPPFYDSLIAKIICWGADRTEAIARMRRALDELVVDGVPTTVSLHRRILSDDAFARGDYSTDFVQRLLEAEAREGKGE